MLTQIGSLILMLATLTGGATAQTDSPSRADWNTVRALREGRKVEVRLEDGRRIVGKVLRVGDGSITVRSEDQEREWQREEVASVAQVRRGSLVKPILWGTAIGAVSVGTLGAFENSRDCGLFYMCVTMRESVLLGAGAGAFVGTVTGALNRIFRRKRTVLYEAPRP